MGEKVSTTNQERGKIKRRIKWLEGSIEQYSKELKNLKEKLDEIENCGNLKP